jgi:hypothetical protein
MRHLTLITVAALVGVTAVACTDDGYYNSRPQYITQGSTYYTPTSTYYTPTYYSPAYYNSRYDRDGDGVPNHRDRRPDNPYRY